MEKVSTTDTQFHAHQSARAPLGWLCAPAFSVASSISLVAIGSFVAALLWSSALLCAPGALQQGAAQPYNLELTPLGLLAFAFAIVGPPVGVFGSVIWVVSTSQKHCLAEHQGQMSLLRQNGCIASSINRRNLLVSKVAFARRCKFLAVIALVTYLVVISVTSISGCLTFYPCSGFS